MTHYDRTHSDKWGRNIRLHIKTPRGLLVYRNITYYILCHLYHLCKYISVNFNLFKRLSAQGKFTKKKKKKSLKDKDDGGLGLFHLMADDFHWARFDWCSSGVEKIKSRLLSFGYWLEFFFFFFLLVTVVDFVVNATKYSNVNDVVICYCFCIICEKSRFCRTKIVTSFRGSKQIILCIFFLLSKERR